MRHESWCVSSVFPALQEPGFYHLRGWQIPPEFCHSSGFSCVGYVGWIGAVFITSGDYSYVVYSRDAAVTL